MNKFVLFVTLWQFPVPPFPIKQPSSYRQFRSRSKVRMWLEASHVFASLKRLPCGAKK